MKNETYRIKLFNISTESGGRGVGGWMKVCMITPHEMRGVIKMPTFILIIGLYFDPILAYM